MRRSHLAGRLVRLRELGPAAYLMRVVRRAVSTPSGILRSRAEMRACSTRRAQGLTAVLTVPASDFREVFRTRISGWARPLPREQMIEEIGEDGARAIIREAEEIRSGVVRVLGMGPVSLNAESRWHTDPYTGHRWPGESYGPGVRPSPYPGGPDIIVPWELSRGHDVLRLAQAYHLTDDGDYARCAIETIGSWLRDNPAPLGVNWVSSMEAGIRAVNWITALAMIQAEVTEDELDSVISALWEHGRFIYDHLEGVPGSGLANNHLIACLSGLIAIGSLLEGAVGAGEWVEFADAALKTEIGLQVLPDGADFESALGYHALVFGLLMPWWLACRVRNCPPDPDVSARMREMAHFLRSCIAPDGLLPEIGDYDAGRVFRMSAWPADPARLRDFRDSIGFAQVAFGSDGSAFSVSRPDLAAWLIGETPEAVEIERGVRVTVFENAGIVVARAGADFLLLDAGGVGQRGRGGHAHDDDLTFVLYADGVPFILDPGTGTYTGDYEKRAWFRGPESHNAPIIVGYRGHDSEKTSAFGMDPGIEPRVVGAVLGEDGVARIEAERWIHGAAAQDVVACRRLLELDTHGRCLTVTDSLKSEDSVAKVVTVRLVVPGEAEVKGAEVSVGTLGDHVFCVTPADGQELSLEQVDYSPAYGAISQATSVVMRWTHRGSSEVAFTLRWGVASEVGR